MPPRILLGVSGGIAAYKAPEMVRRWRERGAEVRCAMTDNARRFVSPLALEVVTGHRVYGEEYLKPQGSGVEEHIELTEWADRLVLAPATANLLALLARGLAPNFLTTLALAWDGPVVVAPAMHPRMWNHPATQENVALLRARGVTLVGPVVGPLASGEIGMGRMADPLAIVGAGLEMSGLEVRAGVGPADDKSSLVGRRVLVSAGPTREPLDPVRFLGNRSSGKMGFALAAEAAKRGAIVDLVSGPVSLEEPPGVRRTRVETALEMRTAMLDRVVDAEVVFMTAAVADYRPLRVASEKLKKETGPPTVELVENPDILVELSKAPGRRLIVGFAAETEDVLRHGQTKLERKGCDLLVVNDVSRADIGFDSDDNEVTVLAKGAPPVVISRRPKRELAAALLDLVESDLVERDVVERELSTETESEVGA
ncbi:MAG: bifunctional phosphopantothenoylcysteine decarboxylase/phosphopantothenate--cysteine ligase CoaBC [Thermoanaerobaculia bacterium]|nr:bifunctional phosphopantothenoylcysteine decarboxylase/phosphopantothenate--cysteine ligase CoaBC [Thermoanaerobaculia bacterium]